METLKTKTHFASPKGLRNASVSSYSPHRSFLIVSFQHVLAKCYVYNFIQFFLKSFYFNDINSKCLVISLI